MTDKITIKDIAFTDEYLEKEEDRIKETIEIEEREESKSEDGFFTLNAETDFEKNILEKLKSENEKISFRIEREKQSNFEQKMRRIKSIKSRRFRKIQRKIKEQREEEENEQSSSSDLRPADILDVDEQPVKKLDGEADDIFLDDFAEEKRAVVESDAPKNHENILPGWNDWTSKGAIVERNKHNVVYEYEDGIEKKKRKDYKLNHVIINEAVDRTDKSLALKLPKNVKEEEYIKKLNEPVKNGNFREKAFRFFKNK